MIKLISCFLQTTLLFSGLALTVNPLRAAEPPLTLYTVNYPLKFFADSIAGKHAEVILPVPKDIDPAFWSPKASEIAELQKADVILLNGANYAKWLPKVSLSLHKLTNTATEFRDDFISLESDIKHNHGAGGEHSHTGTAFTTWLDFAQAEQQAKTVLKIVSNKRADLTAIFSENFIPLQKSLINLDNELTQVGASLQETALLGSHPVYQYLKRRYKLNLESVHWEPEEAPTEAQWLHLQQILKTHPANWMLWEAEPAAKTVSKLEALGIKSIVFSPCANVPETGDFLTVMHKNVENLKTILKN